MAAIQKSVSLSTLMKIAEKLGITMSELMDGLKKAFNDNKCVN